MPEVEAKEGEEEVSCCHRPSESGVCPECASNLNAYYHPKDPRDKEIARLKRIIAKELTENDELGMEFAYVAVLKEELTELKKWCEGSICPACATEFEKGEFKKCGGSIIAEVESLRGKNYELSEDLNYLRKEIEDPKRGLKETHSQMEYYKTGYEFKCERDRAHIIERNEARAYARKLYSALQETSYQCGSIDGHLPSEAREALADKPTWIGEEG